MWFDGKIPIGGVGSLGEENDVVEDVLEALLEVEDNEETLSLFLITVCIRSLYNLRALL